jgi:hypothetical protein
LVVFLQEERKTHLFTITKDLVPDLSLFFQQHASIEPFLKADKQLERAAGEKELYQSVNDRTKVVCLLLFENYAFFGFGFVCFPAFVLFYFILFLY